MESTARLFNCARCRRQVVICRRCDRGHIYCGRQCSESARDESLRAAARRYQGSRAGRFKHAERQRRYRSRQQKVTHQGSSASPRNDSMRSESGTALARFESIARCQFCHRSCSPFVRLDFLRRPGPGLVLQPLGPPAS